jgi:hypothetical protein
MSASPCLKLDEHIVELVQSGVPSGLEAANPLVDGLQREPIDPVPATPAISSDGHQPDRPEHGEVLRNLGLTQFQPINEVANGGLINTESVKERTTVAIRDSVERISRRRCSGHIEIIFPYRYMSSG